MRAIDLGGINSAANGPADGHAKLRALIDVAACIEANDCADDAANDRSDLLARH